MNQSFDARLPKTTTYWIDDEIFFIKITNFFINEEEAKAMAELLIYAVEDEETKGIVIDNREARGVWPRKVNELWQKNTRYAEGIKHKKMATLTDDNLHYDQVNRLSRVSDLNTSKVFNCEFNDQVKAFVLS